MSTDGGELTVGQLARRAGLTTKALRHYDRIGLLHPHSVDPTNGYRRYAVNQVEQARLVGLLREVDVPLEQIRRLLQAGWNDATVATMLSQHRVRLEARITRLRGALHRVDHYINEGVAVAMTDTTVTPTDATDERTLASQLFNEVWTLMENDNRSADDDDRMIHAAHASAFHWLQVGTAVNRVRSHWQCSRVYAVLRRGEPAQWHAHRALAMCQENDIGDWDLAFCYEALARAYSVAGDSEEAARWLDHARTAAADVAEDDDRELVLSDLETITV